MIFLTVGSALPFDRLVEMVDRAVEAAAITGDFFAQIGAGRYVPRFMPYARFLSRTDFDTYFRAAAGVISHAGIGTISTAMRQGKPLLVLPRSRALAELVDDHQVKTACTFASLGHILVLTDPSQLACQLRALEHFVPVPRHPNVAGVARCVGQYLTSLIAQADTSSGGVNHPTAS